MLRRWSILLICAFLVTGCTVTTSTSTGSMAVEDFKFTGADGETRNGGKFKPGEQVITKFKVTGIKKDDKGEVWVQEDLKVLAPDGSAMLDEKNLLDLKQKIEEAGDPFVTADNTVNMPAQAPPGEYKVQMSLRDKVGGGTTTFNSTFHVEGDAAAGETPAAGETSSAGETPSSGGGGALQLAEVRFAEAQEGPDRENSTFAGDEDVWVLFSLTGFEQKEDGGVWIQEDLQVLDPDGTPILDEKNLLDFQEPVDPGLDAIPAHNQITLPEGAAAGDYTVHMVVRDQLAGTSVEQKKTFKVQ